MGRTSATFIHCRALTLLPMSLVAARLEAVWTTVQSWLSRFSMWNRWVAS